MSKIVEEIQTANARYVADFGPMGVLAMPPGGQFAILTCMDDRLDPATYIDIYPNLLKKKPCPSLG